MFAGKWCRRAGEECDDGNTFDGDGVTPTARRVLRNGIVCAPLLFFLRFWWPRTFGGKNKSEEVSSSSNDVEIARVALPNTCGLPAWNRTIEVSDPQLLAGAKNGAFTVSVESTGELSWAAAGVSRLDRGSSK